MKDMPDARLCPASERRREPAPADPWLALVPPRRDGQGFDSYWHLEGRHVSCGSTIELQAIELRYDDDGLRSHTVHLQQGIPVSYELGWSGDDRVPVLHADVGGHRAVIAFCPSMRFRWPEKTTGPRTYA